MCIQWTYTCLSWEVPVLGHNPMHTAKLIAKDTAPRESPDISLVGNLPRSLESRQRPQERAAHVLRLRG